MRVIIDRFEGEFAVVETEKEEYVNLPRVLVPDAKEGDVIDILINHEATFSRSDRIQSLQNVLFED